LSSYAPFSTLVTAAQAAHVLDALAGPGPYTVLAPTDAAFARLSPARLNMLLAHPAQLAELLKCHIIPGTVDPAQLSNGRTKTFRTLGSRTVTMRVNSRGQLLVNTAIVGEIIPASNGNIFALDRVLFVR
jgi:uncharacterized surface protein with fasciclin (FAS1) repeats